MKQQVQQGVFAVFAVMIALWLSLPAHSAATTSTPSCAAHETVAPLSTFISVQEQLVISALRVQCASDELFLSFGSQSIDIPTDTWISGDIAFIVSHAPTSDLPVIPLTHSHHPVILEQEEGWLEAVPHQLELTVQTYEEEWIHDVPINADEPHAFFLANDSTAQFTPLSFEEWLRIYLFHGAIRISELFPNPSGADSEQEYIELHHVPELRHAPIEYDVQEEAHEEEIEAYSLEGFTVADATRTYTLEPFHIEPGTSVRIQYHQSRITLNNQHDTLWLYDASGLPLDYVSYGPSREQHHVTRMDAGWMWCHAQHGCIEEDLRIPPTQEPAAQEDEPVDDAPMDDEEQETEQDPIPPATPETVDQEHDAPTDPAAAEQVRLSEVYASPHTGDPEWIELFHHGSQAVSLAGYQLDDQEGGSKPFLFTQEHTMEPGAFLVIESDLSKIALNNTGDTVRFLSPQGEIIDTFQYERSSPATSWSNTQEGWQETTPTPGSHNHASSTSPEDAQPVTDSDTPFSIGGPAPIVATPQTNEYTSIEAIRTLYTLPEGQRVRITGVVSAPTNVLIGNGLVLQDETAGIQVIGKSADLPSVAQGTELTFIGTTDLYQSVPVVRITDVNDIESTRPSSIPTPQHTTISQATQATASYAHPTGLYVQISGSIAKKQGQSITLTDGAEELVTTIRSRTTLKAPSLKTGDPWTVAGILLPTKSGARLYPFHAADLSIQRTTQGPVSTTQTEDPALSSLSEGAEPQTPTASALHAAAQLKDQLNDQLPAWTLWLLTSIGIGGVALYGAWHSSPRLQQTLRNLLVRIRSVVSTHKHGQTSDRIRVSHQKTGEEGRQRDG